MGAAIALVLPHLDRLSVLVTSYQVDAERLVRAHARVVCGAVAIALIAADADHAADGRHADAADSLPGAGGG